MRRLLVIVLVSSVYVGCATSSAPPETKPRLSSGGSVRVLSTSPALMEALRDTATAGRLAPDGLVRVKQTTRANCVSVGLVAQTDYPDGRPVSAASMIAEWKASLRDAESSANWLLAPVQEGRAVSEDEERPSLGLELDDENNLRICTETPTPDWPARLAHPALWLRGGDGADGPGAFQSSGSTGLLVARSSAAAGRPVLDTIEFLEPRSSAPALMFELDAVDLACLSGREAASLVDDPGPTLRVQRLKQWDTVYALWLGAQARWVNDPRFRAWVAGAVDRETLLRFLFDGRGEPAFRLTRGGGPEWSEPPTRPFSRGSAPRLELIFDSSDTNATSIASRLKAVLELEGLSIQLEPADADRLREATAEDRFQMALVAHRPPVSDPVLALQHTLWSLGNPMFESWDLLVRASWWEEAERRRNAALFAEDTMLRQARLVPLVRLHYWLVTREGLEETIAGPWGQLRLDRAGWER